MYDVIPVPSVKSSITVVKALIERVSPHCAVAVMSKTMGEMPGIVVCFHETEWAISYILDMMS